VVGIREATNGLVNRPPKTTIFDIEGVDRLLVMGGTILGTTNKGDPFAFPMPDGTLIDRSQDIIDGYHSLGLDALIGTVAMVVWRFCAVSPNREALI